jgi:hypothetical protein
MYPLPSSFKGSSIECFNRATWWRRMGVGLRKGWNRFMPKAPNPRPVDLPNARFFFSMSLPASLRAESSPLHFAYRSISLRAMYTVRTARPASAAPW